MTVTCGGVMLGNCEIGRILIARTPRIIIMIEITMAKRGLSIKKFRKHGHKLPCRKLINNVKMDVRTAF